MNFQKIEQNVLGVSSKSIAGAVVGGGLSYLIIPGASDSVDIMGYGIPSWLIFSGVFAASSGLSETAKDILDPITPNVVKSSWALMPMASGAASVAVYQGVTLLLTGNIDMSLYNNAASYAVGMASDIAGSYIVDRVIEPAMKIQQGVALAEKISPIDFATDNFSKGIAGLENMFTLF